MLLIKIKTKFYYIKDLQLNAIAFGVILNVFNEKNVVSKYKLLSYHKI